MQFQLDRPFQAHPLYFDIQDPKLAALLPAWFGAAFKEAPSLRHADTKPLLTISADEPYPLSLIQTFVYQHTTCRDPFFVFHGGAVTRGDSAFLFLASTTTGKTTLITYLTQIGYTYLDDDCFYLNMNTLEVMPYSAPIHLREGGYRYLKSILPSSLPPCRLMEAPGAPRYVFMPSQCTLRATRPKAIFFLNRSENPAVGDQCCKLSASDALNRLFTSALIPYQMNLSYIRFFQRLLPLCHEIIYHDAPFAASVLEAYHD